MGLRNDRLSRLRDAIAAWRQKIENERAAAEATARAEREAAENARELAEKTKATTEVGEYLTELQTLETTIAGIVSDIQTQEAIVNGAATNAQADTTSSDAETERDTAIDASAIITRKVNDLGVQKAALELAYYNIKKSADDYDDLQDEVDTGRTAYNNAIADIDSVADSKKNAESKVSYITSRVSTLIAAEAAAAAEAARLAAIEQAENDRLAAELAKATSDVTMYLTQVQTLAGDIDTTVASLDTASATIGTNKTAAGNATASADAITARDNIAVQSANITVLVNTLGQKAAALETSYGNLVTAASTHETLQDELATGTTEYNDAQTAIQSVSTAKKDAESHLAYAQNAASTLLASEAAAAAAADAAAAQQAAEEEAARVAAEAEAAAIAAAEAKKTEAMQYTDNAISGLIDSAPGTLDTLNELAAALGDDPNFAATVTSQLTNLDNQKVDKINTTGKTVGSSTAIPVITYNNQGQITSASTTAITVGNGAMSVTAGSGLTGGGQVGTANQTGSSSVTISHADTSSVTNIDTSGKVVIDALTFDTYGHVTGATSRSLDFYTTGEADSRYVNVAGDTITSGGNIGLTINHNTFGQGLVLHRNDSSNAASIVFKNNATQSGILYGTAAQDLIWRKGTDTSSAEKVFHDAYHPNADKWTTARNNNINLTGDVTGYGSASVDGTGNWTVTVNTTVGNDSHTHNVWNLPALNAGINIDTEYHNKFYSTQRATETDDGTWPASYMFGVNLGGGPSRGIQLASSYGGGTADYFWFRRGSDNASSQNGANNWQPWVKVFTDDYHPNADKWTTARTLSLSGDASGSVSWDGSANATLSVTVADNSHNHSSSSGDFTVNGDLITDQIKARTNQDLTITAGESYTIISDGTYNDEYIRLGSENGVIVYSSTNNLTSGLNRSTTLIDGSGNMSINSGNLSVSGSITAGGNTVWHAGNLNPASYVSYGEGTSPPSTNNGTMWLNTANGKTYQRQRGVWVQIAPGVGGVAIYDVNGTKVN